MFINILFKKGRRGAAMIFCLCVSPFFYVGLNAQPADFSLDSLLNVKISSVSKFDQSTSEAPASVTILTQQDLQKYGFENLSEALNSVRSIYFGDDRTFEYLGVRGFNRPSDYNNRVLLLFDGHALNENVFGAAAMGRELRGISINMIDRIEIIRGPSSSIYGNSAMQAIVNIVPRKGAELDGAIVSGEAGSFGRIQGEAVFGKRFGNDFDLQIGGKFGKTDGQDLYYEEYDDSTTNNGIAEKIDRSRYYGIQTVLRYKDFRLKAFYTSAEVGYPTGAYETLFNDPNANSINQHALVELNYDKVLSPKLAFSGRIYGDHYREDGFYPYERVDGGLWSDKSIGNWAGVEARVQYDIASSNRIVAGVEDQYNFTSSYLSRDEDTIYFDGNDPFNILSFFIIDEFQPFKKLKISLGGRYDLNSRVKTTPVPRLAFIYFPTPKTTLKAIYNEAYRAPNYFELYAEDPEILKSNPDLKPEKIRSAELVVEQMAGDNISLAATGFINSYRDLIDQIEDPDDELLQFRNVSAARSAGFELEVNGRFEGGFSFFSSYTFQDALNLESMEKLTNSPVNIAKAGLNLAFARHFAVSAEGRFESGRTTVQQTTTDPFFLLNSQFTISPDLNPDSRAAKVLKQVSLRFKVRNVFNTQYAYPGGFEHYQPSIVQDGRNYSLRLTVQI